MDKTSTTIESIFDSQRGIPNTKLDFTEDGIYRAFKIHFGQEIYL